jgi:DNA-binding SARP family transcriptional activator/TolB-like protein/tetratricopeptide (TPR) repeat protein
MEIASPPADRVLLLGPVQVIRAGAQLALPPSRKVRGLLAYLALSSRPVTREKLCELFWDAADDPKSELRWCLSKLRRLVDRPATKRLVADRKQVWIDADSLYVDALCVARTAQKVLSSGSPNGLRSLLALFRGDFLEGLSSERTPSFENWLSSQRHRFGQLRQQLLERLSGELPAADRIDVLRELIEIASFDETPHVALVRTLLGCSLHAEANHQIIASINRFEREGLDSASLRRAFATAQREDSQPPRTICTHVAELDVPSDIPAAHMRRPRLLVMPFTTATPEDNLNADGVTSDIIFGMARLRGVGTIARSTAFSLRNRSPAAAAALVNAQYVAVGRLRRDGGKCHASVELIDPATERIFWADDFRCDAVESFSAASSLTARIVAGLDTKIHIIERNRALLMPPASLDAWQAYHRGLIHMYRFTSDGNREAHAFFSQAIVLDPTFSRSYAGLSFTHYQNAFLLKMREREREQEIDMAFGTAGQALEADPSDPAAHGAMGRALWLRREHAGAISALDQSTRLSPSYASAHYSLAMVHCQIGNPSRAVQAADVAAELSPLDPMLFAIYGARTFGLLRLGKIDEAADFAVRGGEQPNAHVHAHAIAALTLAAAGRMDEASGEWKRMRIARPDYNFKQFEDAFHLVDDLRRIYKKAAKRVQMPN